MSSDCEALVESNKKLANRNEHLESELSNCKLKCAEAEKKHSSHEISSIALFNQMADLQTKNDELLTRSNVLTDERDSSLNGLVEAKKRIIELEKMSESWRR